MSLTALSEPMCVCVRGEEQVCSYSAECAELAEADVLGHECGRALQIAFVGSEMKPRLCGSLRHSLYCGASILAQRKAVAVFMAEICGHWGFVSMSKGSINNWFLLQDYELLLSWSLVFCSRLFNALKLVFALCNFMLRDL